MKKSLLASLLITLTTGAWAQTTAIVNVNIIPMTEEKVIAGQTVIITGDEISEIGPFTDVVVPDDAREELVPGFETA